MTKAQSQTTIQKHRISWDEITRDSLALAGKIKALGKIEGLVGIARGGLVPLAIIANALSIRNVKSVAISSYDGQAHHTAEMLGSVEKIGDGAGWVFIDDLVDTGQSAALIKKRYPKAQLAVIYAKPEGQGRADLFVREMPQDTWLEFPWE